MNVKVHCCIGGRNVNDDVFKLEHGVHIVSGTPGRVFDMIQRRTFKTTSIKMLVLDEADEMLNYGFKDQVYDIYRYLPYGTQCVVVSATLPQEILEMSNKFMDNPLKILVERGRADPGRDQAVLYRRRERRLQVRDAVRSLRFADDHASGGLLQQEAEGRVAGQEDEGGELHSELHAWRHAAEGARPDHGRVQVWKVASPDRHRRLGSWPRRPVGVSRDLLRPTSEPRAVHP